MSECKNPECTQPQVVHGADRRAYCQSCGTSFIADGVPLEQVVVSSFLGKVYPECFFNFDDTEEICTTHCKTAKACKRTATLKDSYTPPVEASMAGALPVACPHCGHRDSGKFCSQCGSPLLQVERKGHFPLQVLLGLFTEWPPYFRTIAKSVFSARAFFEGAFARNSALFFDRTRTLSPSKFFLMNTSAVAIVTIACNYFFNIREERALPLIGDVLDVATVLAFQYIPCLVMLFFLKLNVDRIHRARKKALVAIGEPKLDHVFQAMAYASSVQLLATPMFIGLFDAENFDVFIPLLILGITAKLVSELVLLPQGIAAAAHVPRSAALAAVSGTYGVQLLVLNGLKLIAFAN